MAQIQKGDTFADGQQVTGARLNQLIDSATILPNIITDQTNIATNEVASNDTMLVYDNSATALREATASDLLNSNIPITTSSVTTSSITGGAGVNLVITPASTYKVDVAGAFEADSINSIGATTIGGTLDVTGNASFTAGIGGTSAIKIATGTTAERPASPVAGQLRFNTTSNALEVYSGSAWINGVTSGSATFDGTVNITGAIQYNGTPVYGLYEVVRGYSNGTWPVLTKPAGEIWVFTFNASIAYENMNQAVPSIFIPPSTNIDGLPSEILVSNLGEGFYGYKASTTLSIPAEVTFTSKQVEVRVRDLYGSNTSTNGIYTLSKYKTA